jgi:4a-hydroxytetrahydrobiopterin dehydratase
MKRSNVSKTARKLEGSAVAEALNKLSSWSQVGEALVREFDFNDFTQAMGFVTQVAMVAQEINHHPDIELNYNKLKLTLQTHHLGGLSDKDIELAKRISALD